MYKKNSLLLVVAQSFIANYLVEFFLDVVLRAKIAPSIPNSESHLIRPSGAYIAHSWAVRAENSSESQATIV